MSSRDVELVSAAQGHQSTRSFIRFIRPKLKDQSEVSTRALLGTQTLAGDEAPLTRCRVKKEAAAAAAACHNHPRVGVE